VAHANKDIEEKLDLENQKKQVVTTIPEEDSDSDEESEDDSSVTDSQRTNDAEKKSRKGQRNRALRLRRLQRSVHINIRDKWDLFNEFLSQKKPSAMRYLGNVAFFLVVPSIAVAFLLYYAFGNPIANKNQDADGYASYSWLLLFFGVRQVITFTLAILTQVLLVDFIALRSRIMLKWFGAVVTLLFITSRGWPFIAVFWAVYDFVLLAGDREYARHWGHFQDHIELFTNKNPSGNIPDSEWNYRVIVIAVIAGVLVSLKRLLLSLLLARQTFGKYKLFGDPYLSSSFIKYGFS
jgi:hypothetical protein